MPVKKLFFAMDAFPYRQMINFLCRYGKCTYDFEAVKLFMIKQ